MYQKNPISKTWSFVFLLFALVIPGCDDLVPVSVVVTDESKSPVPNAIVHVLDEEVSDRHAPRTGLRTDALGKGKSVYEGHKGGYVGLKVMADGYATLRKRVPCGKNGIEELITLEKEKPEEP
jgi:hypothetical protein